MPMYLQGCVVCETCKKTEFVQVQYSERNGPSFGWLTSLPAPWILHKRENTARAFCSSKCRESVLGVAEYAIGVIAEPMYDPRTVDKLREIIAGRDVPADTVLSAIEAVLTAWRQPKLAAP